MSRLKRPELFLSGLILVFSIIEAVPHPLLESLLCAPLLIKDLPEARSLPRDRLIAPINHAPLKLSQKLGHLWEDALSLVLENSPAYRLLARNLQIQKDAQTTIGELDYLISEEGSDHLIHLELATKFYFAVQSPSGLTLPGPDDRDNYFKKLDRLRSHQLILAHKYREFLPKEYRDKPIITQHLIYGCLFEHVTNHTLITAPYLNPECRRGYWLWADEISTHFSSETVFRIVPKHQWPVPFNLLNQEKLSIWTPGKTLSNHLMLQVDQEPEPYLIRPLPTRKVPDFEGDVSGR